MNIRLGPFLVQLPPSLQFDPDPAGAFLKLLASHQDAYEFALEARHASWYTPEALAMQRIEEVLRSMGDDGADLLERGLLNR